MRELWHGTLDGYNNHHCRCDLCRECNRIYMKAYRERRRQNPNAPVRKYRRWKVKHEDDEIVVLVRGKEVSRASLYQLAERMILEGKFAKSLHKLREEDYGAASLG